MFIVYWGGGGGQGLALRETTISPVAMRLLYVLVYGVFIRFIFPPEINLIASDCNSKCSIIREFKLKPTDTGTP